MFNFRRSAGRRSGRDYSLAENDPRAQFTDASCFVYSACDKRCRVAPPPHHPLRARRQVPLHSIRALSPACLIHHVLSHAYSIAVAADTAATPLLNVEMLQSAMKSVLSDHDSLPSVRVHKWMDRMVLGTMKLPDTFEQFDKVVRRWTSHAGARFFWFTDARMLRQFREEISATTFVHFRTHARSVGDPSVSIWEPVGTEISPSHVAEIELPAITTPVPVAVRSSNTASSARSSQVQQCFRAAVMVRDGGFCVLCKKKPADDKLIQAAHVVRRSSSPDVIAEAGLLAVDESYNGIMLCTTPCHFWYDQLHWWVDENGLVVASDAILASDELGAHFMAHVGKPLKVPTVDAFKLFWPPASAWAVQRRLCLAETERRHAVAHDKPFGCARCSARFATPTTLGRHASKCVKTSRALLFTPTEKHILISSAPRHAISDADEDSESSSE